MEGEATEKVVLVYLATPPLRVLVEIATPPSLKTTVPLGVPAPGAVALTVAVRTTDWLDPEGLAEEVTAVELLALLTVWVTVPEVLVLKLPSPLYTAVIECEAAESAVVVNVAEVPLRPLVASGVPASLKVTVPVGVPPPGAVTLTVAVKVTDCPDTDGLTEEPRAVVVLAALTVWLKGEAVLSLPVKLLSPA